jgi:type II secretory pathway pseudopilin PulG
MNQRTLDMIRQMYIFVIVIICIAGVIIGITMGKKTAKKTGIQMVETSNRAFDLDIQQSREDGGFGAILEGELQSEKENPDGLSARVPAREKPFADDSLGIVEPDKDRPIKTNSSAIDRQDLPEPSRLDEKKPESIGSVQRPAEKSPKAEINDSTALPALDADKKDGDIRNQKPADTTKKTKSQLKPMTKDEVIAECSFFSR